LAARQCPNCLAIVSPGKVLAYSDDLVCPGCGKPLEISDLSRNVAMFIALAVAVLAWYFASVNFSNDDSALGWILPVVFSYMALSIAAPILLILFADLHLKSAGALPVADATPAPHSPHH